MQSIKILALLFEENLIKSKCKQHLRTLNLLEEKKTI